MSFYNFNILQNKGTTKDHVRDLFSRLKDASKNKKLYIHVGYSKLNILILKKIYKKGLIMQYNFVAYNNNIKVWLKYDKRGFGLLDSLEWFSVPGRRVFMTQKYIKKQNDDFEYLYLTEKGLYFADELIECERGGEYLCKFLR